MILQALRIIGIRGLQVNAKRVSGFRSQQQISALSKGGGESTNDVA